MAIVKLKKVSVICRQSDKDTMLRAIQNFGKLHLNALETNSDKHIKKQVRVEALPNEQLKKALRYLQSCPEKRKQFSWNEELDIEKLIRDICENQTKKRLLEDEYEKLLEREANLGPWGEFLFPGLDALRGQRLWFYILPYKHLNALTGIKLPWQIVHRERHKAWVVLISPDEPEEHILPVDRVHTGAVPLSEVQKQRHDVELAIEDIAFERQRFTRYIDILKRITNRVEDLSNLSWAYNASLDTETLCIIEAWIADCDVKALKELAKPQGFAVYLEEVEAEDTPPTLFTNPPALRGGELLVNFYQTPAYNTWDPSFILFASFSLFFAMIMSDAAYSAILIGLLVFSWKKLGRSDVGKSLRPLLACVTGVSFVWGVIVGSYFGKEPSGHLLFLQQFHKLDVNNFNTMMALSIGCGVLHIFLANFQQFFLWRGHTKALMHLGWIFVLLGGSVLGLHLQSTIAYTLGVFGLILVFIGGGQRKIASVKDLLIRVLEGLKAVSNITNIFGDVLSYLRLFALGLASASLALTFNNLADNAFASENGLGLLFGLLILIVGHAMNLFLGIVSGVVHGLRLNFIEFYKWALDGEGKPFKAFKKQEFSQ